MSVSKYSYPLLKDKKLDSIIYNKKEYNDYKNELSEDNPPSNLSNNKVSFFSKL